MKKQKLITNLNSIKRNNVEFRRQSGITLIALIITVIVMLILAGVTINLTLGQNGIFKTAQKAARNYTDAQNKEFADLNEFNNQLAAIIGGSSQGGGSQGGGNQEEAKPVNKPNEPQLLTGMTPIKFTDFKSDATDTTKSVPVVLTNDLSGWYNYDEKKWANAQTADGSMWVWIPRYAYRINSSTQTCDVVFLDGKSNNYYDENGQIQTAKRQTAKGETIDTTTGYTVHPAFTNESGIDFANGGWDDELKGIWVAKFEAGYAGGNNNATKGVSSSVNYTQTDAWVPAVEAGKDGGAPARNWTDGEYGATPTAIKYPTFQGTTYSMNYINHNDAFNISRALTGANNIYGLNSTQTDSHLMKDSEWGAVAYLGQSKYGLNGKNIYINNVCLNNSTQSVYAVTGCSSKISEDADVLVTTIDEIKNGTAACYEWNQKGGQRGSSTGTIYGIYDMSGGTWERMASYVANGHVNLGQFGKSIAYNGDTLKKASTKYTMVYPHDETKDNKSIQDTGPNLEAANVANYAKNTHIYGDAIRETSTAGRDANSWYGDFSWFPGLYAPFSVRSGGWGDGSYAGLFYFNRTNGNSDYYGGFRSVLVAL